MGELINGLAEHHRLEQGLEQDGGLGADDVGAEQGSGGRIGDQLDEAGGVLEGLPVGGVGSEMVGVGTPTCGDEESVRPHDPPGSRRLHREGDPAAVARDALDARGGEDLDPLGAERLGERLAEFRLIAAQQRRAGDDRHLAAEAGEHLGELDRDVPAAQDDE